MVGSLYGFSHGLFGTIAPVDKTGARVEGVNQNWPRWVTRPGPMQMIGTSALMKCVFLGRLLVAAGSIPRATPEEDLMPSSSACSRRKTRVSFRRRVPGRGASYGRRLHGSTLI